MSKITQYEPLPDPADNDLLAVVDVSDQTMAYSGTDKRATVGSLPFLPATTGTPTDGQVPAFTGSGLATTPVTTAASVFGRTGAVVAETGDYTYSQVGADQAGAASAAQTAAQGYAAGLAVNAAYNAGNVLESPASIDICRAYGMVPGDDVTTAIQDALNTLATAGTGGEVVISIPGSYTVNGALQSATVLGYTYDGQILIPAVSPSENSSLALTIRGMVPPMGGGEGRPSGGGVTLVSNAASGWVFDCVPANSAFASPNPWTNVALAFENLILEVPNNPQCGGVNALCCLQFRAREFYGQTAFYTTGGSAPPALTGTSEFLVMPGWESEGMNVLDRCAFRNVPIAFRFGEHMLLNYVSVYYANIVFNCPKPINGHGLFFNELDIENCAIVFNATSDLSSSPIRVYGTMDYEYDVVPMTAFVSQPVANGDDGSFVGSVKVHSINSGGFPLYLGAAASNNYLGYLEITNLTGFGDQSWKHIHPQDNFTRVPSPLNPGIPSLSYPTFHPWSLQQGSFKVTNGTGLQSTAGGNSIALVPCKENGISRLVQATLVLPASGYAVALIANYCRPGTNAHNWIGAYVNGTGSIDLVTGHGTTITTVIPGPGLTSGGSTVTVGLQVLCNAFGIPAQVALYVNGTLESTCALTAAQQAALNYQTGAGSSQPYSVGGFHSAYDGLIYFADQVTACTWFGVQDSIPAPVGMLPQAVTPVGGYALVNGTGNVISWTAPNDGQQHRFSIYGSLNVTSAETGGVISVSYTVPNGAAASHTLFAGTQGTGVYQPSNFLNVICEAGSTVTVAQTSALSPGAAVMWAEIWGS